MAATAALSPYMAQNIGAGNFERAHEAFIISLKMILKVMLIAWVILFALAKMLSGIFSNDPEVIAISTRYLQIMPAGAIMYSLFIIFNTAFNAHHNSKLTLLSSCARLALFMVPCAWLGNELYGVTGLYFGCVVGNVCSVILAGFIYQKNIRTAVTETEA